MRILSHRPRGVLWASSKCHSSNFKFCNVATNEVGSHCKAYATDSDTCKYMTLGCQLPIARVCTCTFLTGMLIQFSTMVIFLCRYQSWGCSRFELKGFAFQKFINIIYLWNQYFGYRSQSVYLFYHFAWIQLCNQLGPLLPPTT